MNIFCVRVGGHQCTTDATVASSVNYARSLVSISFSLPSKHWLVESLQSANIIAEGALTLSGHNWRIVLHSRSRYHYVLYARKTNRREKGKNSDEENQAEERKKTFLRRNDFFPRKSGIWRVVFSLSLSFIQFPLSCSARSSCSVHTRRSIFRVIVQDSLSSHERVASLKLFQLSKLNCLL